MVTSRLSLLLLLGGAKDKAQSSDSERTSSAHGMIAIDKLRLRQKNDEYTPVTTLHTNAGRHTAKTSQILHEPKG